MRERDWRVNLTEIKVTKPEIEYDGATLVKALGCLVLAIYTVGGFILGYTAGWLMFS